MRGATQLGQVAARAAAGGGLGSVAVVPLTAAEQELSPSPEELASVMHTHLLADCTAPASWYPTARSIRRRIIAHLGPTNSGKTHAALEALKAANSGTYCGPLRLLASEVAERLNVAGVPTHLITGQERQEVPGARHAACTVEMASTRRVLDVGVVDEGQLAADQSRGWAFSRALLGLPARELHVCGDPAMLPMLQHIADEAGDVLEVHRYQRLSPLRAARSALGSLDRLKSGDAVVAFSRRGVHALRAEIEALGQHSVAVVYGALPPGPRRQQAQLFNEPRSGVGVLAASDAIGLGLNLRIRRLVFSSLRKFDGVSDRPLTPPEIRQIAGRAGRHTTPGVCTTLDEADLPALRAGLSAPHDEHRTARILPPFAMLQAFAAQHPRVTLPQVLLGFEDAATTGHRYSMAHAPEVLTLAHMLEHLPGLSLRESYLFAIAPADPDDAPVAAAFLRFASAYARQRRVHPGLALPPPSLPARSEAELAVLESWYRILDLYIWLAFRFPDAFVEREAVEAQRSELGALIDASLREMGLTPAQRRRQRRAG